MLVLRGHEQITQGWDGGVSKICTEPLVLGWFPQTWWLPAGQALGSHGVLSVLTVVGWDTYSISKICADPSRFGVVKTSGELVGETHC